MKIADEIDRILRVELQPTHLQVLDESHMHNVPKGTESHFKVILVTDIFEGASLIARHRAVNEHLTSLRPRIHALSLKAYTVKEWEEKGKMTEPSPQCRGGSKVDR